MKQKRQKKVFTPLKCDVIKLLRRTEKGDGYNHFDLRIVKWEKGKDRMLEKRHTWTLKDGSLRTCKLVGFTLDDVNFILENQKEITQILKGETEVHAQTSDTVSGIHSSQSLCQVGGDAGKTGDLGGNG